MVAVHRAMTAVLVGLLVCASTAAAQESTGPVIVNTAVEVPNAVLQPGEYTFARTDVDDERALIRVYEQRDPARVITTMLAMRAPQQAAGAAAGALIPFGGSADAPSPAQYWLDAPSGRTYELVYPRGRAASIAAATGARVLSAEAPDAGALRTAPVTAVVDQAGRASESAGTAATARRGTTTPPPPNVAAPVGGETNPTGATRPTGNPTSRTETEPAPQDDHRAAPDASTRRAPSAASSNPATGEPAPTPAVTDPAAPRGRDASGEVTRESGVPNTTTQAGFPNSTAPIRGGDPRSPATDAATGYQRDRNRPATPSPETTRERPAARAEAVPEPDSVAPDPTAAPTMPAPGTPPPPVDPSDPATRRNDPAGVGLRSGVAAAGDTVAAAPQGQPRSDLPDRAPAGTLPETAGIDGWLLLAGGVCLALSLWLRFWPTRPLRNEE